MPPIINLPSKIRLTLTGADGIHPLGRAAFINAEVGVLYSAKSAQDRTNRYPSAETVMILGVMCQRSALHICGTKAREEFFSGQLHQMVQPFERIQINGVVSFGQLWDACKAYPSKTIITQHTEKNAGLLSASLTNHAVLIDGSGGKGILPDEWPMLETEKAVGFAGGLGPETLKTELAKILKVARPGAWIDMESSLRNQFDHFDLEACEKVEMVFNAIVRDHVFASRGIL